MVRRLFSVALAVCLSLSVCITAAEAEPRAEYGKIELVRDEWGVPNVFSDTDEGAMYGLGYATAEDRAFQMYYSLRIVQGRLAEVVGGNVRSAKHGTALENDVKWRTMGFYDAAKKLVPNLDEETVRLLEAYSAGVNDYMSANRDKLVYMFEKFGVEPDPWTPADCIASWWHVGSFFAKDGLGDWAEYRHWGSWTGRGPWRTGDDTAAVVQREDVSDEWVERVEEFVEKVQARAKELSNEESPKFSHAWVAGGKKTTTGAAVLASDPQSTVRNPSLFYEFHVAGETFNARGIGTAGSPAILIGYSGNVAWGMTALGADQADLFVLKTDAEHPNKYLYDGKWRDMTTREEVIKVKGGNPVRLTVKETHMGPVVTGLLWRGSRGKEIALKRVPACETDRETIEGAMAMMRAKDAYEFADAIGGWRFPTANCVFGDRDGNVGYSVLGAIPVRSPLSGSSGSSAHDGSESKYDWQGFVPYDLVPRTINPERGYVFSGNHRPIGSFYPAPLGVGTGGSGDTIRSWRLREMMASKEKMTPEDVLDMHYDCVNPAKREIVRLGYHIRDVMGMELSRDALRTLEHLEDWYKSGARSDWSVKGTELVNAMPLNFRRNPLAVKHGGGLSGLAAFLKGVMKRLEEEPKAALTSQERGFVDSSLASAWRDAERAYGNDPEKWHEKGLAAVRRETLPYFTTLDGFSGLDRERDVAKPQLICDDGNTILSQMSEAYTQWVPMHDVDSARTILPVGQSENPKSKYWLNNLETWGEGTLHPAPITREGVEKYAAESKLLSEAAEGSGSR